MRRLWSDAAGLFVLLAVSLSASCKINTSSNPNTTSIPRQEGVAPTAAPRALKTERHETWKIVGENTFDWNGRHDVRVVQEKAEPVKSEGAFERVTIRVPGETPFVLEDDSGWLGDHTGDPGLPFLLIPVSVGRDVIVLRGVEYEPPPGRMTVLELPAQGGPRQVFRGILDLLTISDQDGDNVAELVGAPCISQAMSEDGSITTYDPVHVMKFGKSPGDKMIVSEALSKKYNEDNYVWAGLECSEKLAVVRKKGSKLRVVKAEDLGQK